MKKLGIYLMVMLMMTSIAFAVCSPPVPPGDWNITDTQVCNSQNILVNGSVNIYGNLTFDDINLTVIELNSVSLHDQSRFIVTDSFLNISGNFDITNESIVRINDTTIISTSLSINDPSDPGNIFTSSADVIFDNVTYTALAGTNRFDASSMVTIIDSDFSKVNDFEAITTTNANFNFLSSTFNETRFAIGGTGNLLISDSTILNLSRLFVQSSTGDIAILNSILDNYGNVNVLGTLNFNNVIFNNKATIAFNSTGDGNISIHDSILNGSLFGFSIFTFDNSSLLFNNSNSTGVGFTSRDTSEIEIINGDIDNHGSISSTGNSTMIISGSTFTGPGISTFTGDSSTNIFGSMFTATVLGAGNVDLDILESTFTGTTTFSTNADVTINSSSFFDTTTFQNSVSINIMESFLNRTLFRDSSYLTIQNTTIFNVTQLGNSLVNSPTLNFTLPKSTIENIVELRFKSSIYGYVDMPSDFTTLTSPQVERFYPITLLYNTGAPVANQQLLVFNSTGGLHSTIFTDANGFANVLVNYTSATLNDNFTLRANNTYSTNITLGLTTDTGSFNLGSQIQLNVPSSTGGGPSVPPTIDVATIETFDELLQYPAEQLAQLTTTQLDTLIENLNLNAGQILLLFSKITSAQQLEVFNMQGGGTQQELTTLACITGDLKCPSFCTAASDSDCPGACGDGIAQVNEDYLSCPVDVKFKLDDLFSLDTLKKEKFLQAIFFIIIAGSIILGRRGR